MALKAPPYNMNGRYADIMATECSKHGMKPVCARSDRGDTQCRYDPAALYIGNSYDLTIPKYRTSGYTPCGFSAISYAFAGLCLYRNYSSDPRVYCNIPARPAQSGLNQGVHLVPWYSDTQLFWYSGTHTTQWYSVVLS